MSASDRRISVAADLEVSGPRARCADFATCTDCGVAAASAAHERGFEGAGLGGTGARDATASASFAFFSNSTAPAFALFFALSRFSADFDGRPGTSARTRQRNSHGPRMQRTAAFRSGRLGWHRRDFVLSESRTESEFERSPLNRGLRAGLSAQTASGCRWPRKHPLD